MKSIIVGTDFSKCSMVALDLATQIANTLKCDVTLVYVQPNSFFDSDLMEHERREAMVKLREIGNKYQPQLPNGTIYLECMKGSVASTLADFANRQNAPLLVVGAHGASGFQERLIGSTAMRILQESPCPCLTIREGFVRDKLKNIVVPLRDNDNSRQKIAPAATVASVFGATIHIVGFLEYDDQRAVLQAYVQQGVDYYRNRNINVETIIVKNSSYSDAVMEYAEKVDADLIVINTEQNKVIQQLFLGTNAQKLVNKSKIPVLSIHPEDFIDVSI